MIKNKERKRFKNGELTWMILKILSGSSLGLENLADRILNPGFGHKGQFTKSQFIVFKKRCWERKREHVQEELKLEEKVKISVLINRLQKMGLVKRENTNGKKATWSITNDGLAKTLKLEEKIISLFSRNALPRIHYPILKSKYKIIVIFDIAETEKYKRIWLRQVLRELSFEMLQKSVWIGENQFPPDLIRDLGKLNLMRAVKIFSIFEEGNIDN